MTKSSHNNNINNKWSVSKTKRNWLFTAHHVDDDKKTRNWIPPQKNTQPYAVTTHQLLYRTSQSARPQVNSAPRQSKLTLTLILTLTLALTLTLTLNLALTLGNEFTWDKLTWAQAECHPTLPSKNKLTCTPATQMLAKLEKEKISWTTNLNLSITLAAIFTRRVTRLSNGDSLMKSGSRCRAAQYTN